MMLISNKKVYLQAFAWLVILAATTARAQTPPHPLFVTHENCVACHNGLVTATGEDVSIGKAWAASMMANSARDPYWQASIRRETLDHPESSAAIQDECSACHMPMARFTANRDGREGEVFSHLPFKTVNQPGTATPESLLAEDGVSCTLCHQITAEGLGTPASFVAGFHIDTNALLGNRREFGPFDIDGGRQQIMRSSALYQPTMGDHVRRSELCATCHTLITDALGAQGSHIGRLFEQMPYQEWQHSDFAGKQSCQDCHMPVVEESTRIASVLGPARDGLKRHVFVGGNFFILGMLDRYRDALDVKATPQALQASVERTLDHLQSGAAGSVAITSAGQTGDVLSVDVDVANASGHKLPTAYPSRRVWIHLLVRDSNGDTVFESGRFNDDGSITGNVNDADPDRFEPHYREITAPDQVQIYEGIIAGEDGHITTGLLTATRYLKDNRLLPRGFDKASADSQIATRGDALDDGSFTDGRDAVRYRVDVDGRQGPFTVTAELWYQPISYRWAENLAAYDSVETRRFVDYYHAMSATSAIVMDSASLTTPR